jgi:hypothetical protein
LSKQTVYVHYQDSEVVGVSSNAKIAIKFIVGGENRIVKEFALESTTRSKNGLIMKLGRKAKTEITEKLKRKPISKK